MASAGARLAIDGMVCGSCTSAVTSALEGTAGVRAVSVSLESKSASVTYDPGSVDADALRDVVEACGFDVTAVDPEAVAEDADARVAKAFAGVASDASPRKPSAGEKRAEKDPLLSERVSERVVTLAIGGMSCKRCSDWVTRALMGVPGVITVDVDLKTHVATVLCAAAGAALVRRVSETGYTAKIVKIGTSPDVPNELSRNGETAEVSSETSHSIPPLHARDVSITAFNFGDEMDAEAEPLFAGDAETSSAGADFQSSASVATLRVSGMSCASCVAKVEEAARSVPGVQSAAVNLLAETATVTFAARSSDEKEKVRRKDEHDGARFRESGGGDFRLRLPRGGGGRERAGVPSGRHGVRVVPPAYRDGHRAAARRREGGGEPVAGQGGGAIQRRRRRRAYDQARYRGARVRRDAVGGRRRPRALFHGISVRFGDRPR
jgi:copper ion binding protein